MKIVLYIMVGINLLGSFYILGTAMDLNKKAANITNFMKVEYPEQIVRARIEGLRYGIRFVTSRISSECWYSNPDNKRPDEEMEINPKLGVPLEVRFNDAYLAPIGALNEKDGIFTFFGDINDKIEG